MNEHYDLCCLCSDFPGSIYDQFLLRKNGQNHTSVWSSVRHYIGRLGSWHRAAKLLLRAGSQLPQCFQHVQVKSIENTPITPAPSPDGMTNIHDALRRMIPADQDHVLEELRDCIKQNPFFESVDENFIERYRVLEPKVHAEMMVLEHFHQNDLDFVDNCRYIGCSKPSCYCCNLYMVHHPAPLLPRPSHGNIWIKWAPPTSIYNTTVATRKYTRDRLDDMIKPIRRALLSQIRSRSARRPRVPDSTTGLSSLNFLLSSRDAEIGRAHV